MTLAQMVKVEVLVPGLPVGEQSGGAIPSDLVLRSLSSNVMVIDSDLRIVYVNPAMKRLLQSLAGDLPEFQPHSLRDFDETHRAQIIVAGRSLTQSITPLDDESGVRLGYSVEWCDITDESRMAEVHKNVAAALEAAADNDLSVRVATAGVGESDLPVCVATNALIETLDNLSSELSQMSFGHHISDNDVAIDVGKFLGSFKTIAQGVNDMVDTRRRTAEALAEAAQAAVAATAAKSSFLATMSHEIRTPMNAVIGMTDLLLATNLDSRQREYVETVRTSGDALLAVINDILDFSRFEAGDVELEELPFDLGKCVDESLSLVAVNAAGLDLVAEIDPTIPRFVLGDARKLRQVLVNLIGNAVKFTHRGDVLVRVAAAERSAGPGDTDDVDQSSSVTLSFSVRDTGIGIPAERMDRLFRSFSQVDASTTRVYGGTGLGLAISRAIVRAMGGDITVTRTVGVGSTFGFQLSFQLCPDDMLTAEPHPASVDLAGRKALIVDDNDTNRRVLRLQLEGWGMSCIDVAEPRQALAVLSTEKRFDVAVLDMSMPGMDGAQLAEEIQAMPGGRQLPMILLTSLDSGSIQDHRFVGCHTKPVRAQALRMMLAEVLSGASTRTPEKASGIRAAKTAALRVLVAEDNLVNQAVAQGLLSNLGHLADIAADGREALEALRRTEYDVVLMDIHMPGLDGLEATRAIRAEFARGAQPHIIAMTASALPEDRRACIEAGMDGYLLKPVRASDLADALDSVPWEATILGRREHRVHEDGEAVDLSILARLIADMGADSPHQEEELIDAFLAQADRWIGDLVAAAQDGDSDVVRRITHTLSSSSALIGALSLAELLTKTRLSAETGVGALKPAVSACAAEYRRVSIALHARKRSLTSPVSVERGTP